MEHTKKCPKCQQVKDKTEFNKSSTTKDGCQSRCKSCKQEDRRLTRERDMARSKAWYEENRDEQIIKFRECRKENPEVFKERDKLKYEKHKDKIKVRMSEYQKNNPEINRRASKKYRDANPHLGRAKAAKRRARLAQATPKWFEDEWEQFYISEIYHLAQLRSEATSTDWHVDHCTPLTSDTVCGLHCAANLQLLPALENLSKHNRYWPDMPLQCDELLVMIDSFKQTQGEVNERRI